MFLFGTGLLAGVILGNGIGNLQLWFVLLSTV